jgi:protein SCO1/2
MNHFALRRAAIALFAALACAPLALQAAAPAKPPGTSIYQLPAKMVDQNGKAFTLGQQAGHPVLVSMFYNSCEFVCPMLIDTMHMTEEGLTPAERGALSMLLITFDPARDDVKVLKSVADKRNLDPARWTLARTDAQSVRKIAATLDIQYRLLSNGEYNHSTVLVLLDGEGRIVGHTKKMGALDPAFLDLVRKTIAGNAKPQG